MNAPEKSLLETIKAPHFPIYMDYSATTPVDPRVADKMIPYLREQFGNPASRSHMYGWTAEKAVEEAREVAKLVNADPREIIWTSGATESTTWPSRARRSSTRPRASTSSPSRPSTRRCWTPCANWSARALKRPTWNRRTTA
jgi:selenocysteine lyase/cysteine desulfurase